MIIISVDSRTGMSKIWPSSKDGKFLPLIYNSFGMLILFTKSWYRFTSTLHTKIYISRASVYQAIAIGKSRNSVFPWIVYPLHDILLCNNCINTTGTCLKLILSSSSERQMGYIYMLLGVVCSLVTYAAWSCLFAIDIHYLELSVC